MRVAMIGAGYVGLVSGACFADFGHQVTCIDKDASRIAALKNGEIPIFEPGLAELVEANVRQGRLDFTNEASSVAKANAVFIAVGTPSRRGDGYADLSFVYEAVREIAAHIAETAVVVTKSTVPVGTGDEIERILRETRPDAELQVVSNPEFLREGAAIPLITALQDLGAIVRAYDPAGMEQAKPALPAVHYCGSAYAAAEGAAALVIATEWEQFRPSIWPG
jgi:UDPglucose 6-dehydrogenase